MPSKREIELELKEIGELLDKRFFIPHYQRGYRWDDQQVQQLIRSDSEIKRASTACSRSS